MTWITGENGNRASIERWGSEEAAKAALATLTRCSNCSNCSGCSDCSDCSDCSRCSRCSNCYGCFNCSNCSNCSGCSDCSDCYGCFNCSNCSGCSDCSDCFNCSNCSRCSDCSNCSGCSDCFNCSNCSNCSRCSRCSNCYDKRGEKKEGFVIPVIKNIHKKIYKAASKKGCLDMGTWHTCQTTHCRAGWTVHLAGDAGYELERQTTPLFAAMQIYKASGYQISPCRFFDSNEKALEDMKKLATTKAK